MRKRKAKHTDVAAYVLGVLDQVETYAFEQHLRSCVRCGRQVAEFTSVKGALAKADLRYLSPGGGAPVPPDSRSVQRCGRLPLIAANLVLVVLACVVAAMMTSHRSSGRWRRVRPTADIVSSAPLDDNQAGNADQRLLPLPLPLK